MTKEEFVRNFKTEKDRLLATYFLKSTETSAGKQICQMQLSASQSDAMRTLLDNVLTDSFYSILIGLDGCSRIGNLEQQNFKIQSEDGSYICCGDGEIEALAYKYFQKNL